MAMRRSDMDRAIGIIAIVLGVLVLFSRLSVGWLVYVAGVVLLVFGILILVKAVRGTPTTGVVFVVLGALLFTGLLGVSRVLGDIVDIVVGVGLIIVGVMKLR